MIPIYYFCKPDIERDVSHYMVTSNILPLLRENWCKVSGSDIKKRCASVPAVGIYLNDFNLIRLLQVQPTKGRGSGGNKSLLTNLLASCLQASDVQYTRIYLAEE